MQRPFSTTVAAGFTIFANVTGLLSFAGRGVENGSTFWIIWGCSECGAGIICAIYILSGKLWARWVYMAILIFSTARFAAMFGLLNSKTLLAFIIVPAMYAALYNSNANVFFREASKSGQSD
jgi:hypothetical protein